jgi:hypothetical protein
VKIVLIAELICPKANDLAVSNAKLLITAAAIVKLPIGRQDTKRIASKGSRGSSKRRASFKQHYVVT